MKWHVMARPEMPCHAVPSHCIVKLTQMSEDDRGAFAVEHDRQHQT